jgi:lipopolysaccharide assembly outer membrane protein LptD (OstA)
MNSLFDKSNMARAALLAAVALAAATFAGPPGAPADTAHALSPRQAPQVGRDTAAAQASLKAAPQGAADSSGAGRKASQALVDTVYYSAEGGAIDYDVEHKKLYLIHNAMVKYQDITLNADSITYLIEDGLLIASGKPQLVEKSDTTVGESMVYNMKTKRGRVKYASAHMDDAYFNGNTIVKSESNELYIDEGDYTTCAFIDTPDYYFYGKNVKVIPNDKVVSKPVVFAIAEAPIGALPYFIFPLERNRQSGFLTPIWGGHPESGGYLDNIGYYYVPNDYMDFTAWTRIQEFQDFVFNGTARYSLKYWLNGSIAGRYAQGGNFMNKSDQWSLDYTHSQNLTPDGTFTLSGRGSLVGTKTFYQSFSEDSSELLNQRINANLSLSKTFPSINANLNATWNRDHNLSTNQVTEDIPSVNFSLPSRAIIPFTPDENGKDSAKWFNDIFVSYSASGLQRHNVTPTDTSQTYYHQAVNQDIGLSSPQKIAKYFTVNPYFSVHASMYDAYMDTTAYRIDTVQDTTFDTLTTAELTQQLALHHDSMSVVDTLILQNFASGTYDTTYRTVKSLTPRQMPRYATHKQWTSDYTWKTGVSLSTILYGMVPLHIFSFAGLRHVFTPSISYNFVPRHDLDKKFFLSYEGPRPRQSQSIGLSVSNEFQGKLVSAPAAPDQKPVEKKFQILSAGLSTAYDFEALKRKWSDLSLNASTSYNIVRVSYSSAFWLYDQNDKLSSPLLRTYTVSLSPSALGASGSFWEGDKIVFDSLQPKNDPHYRNAGPQKWQFSLNPSYSFTQSRTTPVDPFVSTKNYNLGTSAGLSFTRNWSVTWSSTYNFVANQFVDHDLHFHFDRECWELRFDWRPSGYNPGYYFLINIKKIPEIKWEKRG